MIGYQKELVFQGLILKSSVRFLTERPLNFWDILIWIIFTGGLIAIILFQQLSFSYYNRKNNNLYDLSNPGIWGILNIIEYIWGLRFLKDSCSFVTIQLSLCFQAMPLIGTGEKGLVTRQRTPWDGLICSVTTGDQWPWVLSSMLS